jgi:hypothetical protein
MMFVKRRRVSLQSGHIAKLAVVFIGLLSFVITGCVESRARYTPVPETPTSVPIPSPTPMIIPPIPTPTPVPTATAAPTPLPKTIPEVLPTVFPTPTAFPTPTVFPTPTMLPTPTVVPTASSGTFNLSLNFEGIGDESIVRGDTVLLRGITSADAIVSVNDVIVEVQADGTFELTIVLLAGPNFVDVVASNLDGSSHSSSLAIISIPPEVAP